VTGFETLDAAAPGFFPEESIQNQLLTIGRLRVNAIIGLPMAAAFLLNSKGQLCLSNSHPTVLVEGSANIRQVISGPPL